MRRISRVLARSGAALALAGATAGSAAQAPASPAAAAKPLTAVSAVNLIAASSRSSASVANAARPASRSAVAAKPAPAPSIRSATLARTVTRASSGVPCSAAAAACVDLSRQVGWFVRGGRVMRGPVRLATGRSGYGTATGTFHVYRKNRMWYSTLYNYAPMPYSVFFDGGEAFHEGSVYVRSHGCIHLGASDAAWVFGFLRIGDEVQVVW